MRNVRAKVVYDGSLFYGWQRQDGFVSVQQAFEEALSALVGEATTVHGAGRTDTGVHSLGQVASFHVDTRLTDDRLRHALNAHLVDGVCVERLETCRDDFHAQLRRPREALRLPGEDARRASGRPARCAGTPIGRALTALDVAAMRLAAAQDLLGEHDFSAFANAGSPRARPTCARIARASTSSRRRRSGRCWSSRADGFLYNMVRTIAGTLLDVGRGRLATTCVRAALETGERDVLGPTAPASGLYLLSTLYSEDVFAGPDAGPRGRPGVFPIGDG